MKVKLANNIDMTVDIRKTKKQGETYTIEQYLDIVNASSFIVNYHSVDLQETRRYPSSQFLKAYTHYLRLEKRSINDALRRVHSIASMHFSDTKTDHFITLFQYVSSSNIGL